MESYFRILTEMKNAVSSDDVNAYKTLYTLLNHVNSSEDVETIWNYVQNAYERLGNINLICLACKSSAEKVLDYLFSSENFVYNLPYVNHKNSLVPEVEDEDCHNAFYYAIRSNVCSLVEMLIKKWPNGLLKESSGRVENLLSKAYKDVLIRNVYVSKDMEMYIKNKLMDLRFFDDAPVQSNAPLRATDIQYLKNITELRCGFVIESIAVVNDQIRESKPDELVLLSLKYIEKNVHMLKTAIVSTPRLPWEEIEFCIVIYIRSCSNRFEKYPLYHMVLNGKRLAAHLGEVSSILCALKNNIKTARIGKKRKLIIEEIAMDKNGSNCCELYRDFTVIRDLYSLETIKRSIDLAISADATQKECQLLITRSLQMIGEHLKNTEGSPKLSKGTKELLLSMLPPGLDKIITGLRDCLSHAKYLCFRSEVEENGVHFFSSIQSDINQMSLLVNEMLREKKDAIISPVVKKLEECGLKSYLEENTISSSALKEQLEEYKNFNLGCLDQLEKLVTDLQEECERDFCHATTLYRQIHDVIRENYESESCGFKPIILPSIKREIVEILKNFVSYNYSLIGKYESDLKPQEFISKQICKFLRDELISQKLKVTKSALLQLKTFLQSSKIEALFLFLKTFEVETTISQETIEEYKRLISDREEQIDSTARCRREKLKTIQSMILQEKQFVRYFQNRSRNLLLRLLYAESGKVEYMDAIAKQAFISPADNNNLFKTRLIFEGFLKQLNEEVSFKRVPFQKPLMNLHFFLALRSGKTQWIKEFQLFLRDNRELQLQKSSKEMSTLKNTLKDQLVMKTRLLKNILNDYHLEGASSEKIQLFEKNPMLKLVIEMLLLDITECLSDHFTHNPFFLDDDCPLVNGKNFRNHLAHGNASIDILFGDYFINLLLNASKMVKEDLFESNRKIGKKVKNDPRKSNDSHVKDLEAAKEQLALFAALIKGNMEAVVDCIKNGADMKGRNLNLWTTLHFAAQGPNLELVKFAIKFNSDVEVKDANLQTALHIASVHGRSDTVQYLVEEMKMDTNIRDKDGKTALHLASQKGYPGIVALLLKCKADPSSQDMLRRIPIHYAIEENHTDIVDIFLERESNVLESQKYFRRAAINLAAKNGQLKLVEILMRKAEDVDVESNVYFTTLDYAAMGGNAKVVEYLIARGSDVRGRNRKEMTSLHMAVIAGHDEIVDILIEHGADVNAFDFMHWTPLSYAARAGNLQILERLLEKGAIVNVERGPTPLELAVSFGYYEIAKRLLCASHENLKITALRVAADKGYKNIVELFVKDGVNVNGFCPFEKNVTALHFAAIAGHADIVNLLIENGCLVNTIIEYEGEDSCSLKQLFIDSLPFQYCDFTGYLKYLTEIKSLHGQTALHLSSKKGRREVVRCLIKNKADTLIKDDFGLTPLQCMVVAGMTDILMEEQVPVNNCDYDELCPLWLGAKENDLEFVKYCLEKGCKINKQGRYSGYTPLHSAILFSSEEMVKYLLEKGADISAVTKLNHTVLDLAVHKNRKDMVEFLINRNFAFSEKTERQLFLTAVHGGCEDMVGYFLSRNPKNGLANVDSNEYPLHVAVGNCHRNVLKMLLRVRKGCGINDKNGNGLTPLVLAVEYSFCEIVQLLLSEGADPNIATGQGVLPLHSAIDIRSIEMVKLLIKAKANIFLRDSRGISAIELATVSQDLDILEILLEKFKDHINFRGQERRKLLQVVVTLGDLQTVKYFIERIADINAFDSEGDTTMQNAAMFGHQHIIEYFLGFRNIDSRIKQFNLVHRAAAGNQSELCEFLYNKSLDFNAFCCENGYTPLSKAIQKGHLEVFYSLLHFGSYYNARYKRKKMLLQVELRLDHFVMMVSLVLISQLFSAVCKNDASKTEALLSTALTLSKFGFASVRNSKNISLLHYAAWKGHGDIVDTLLKYKANPNAINNVNRKAGAKKGGSPLHYASKFSHFRIVKAFLCHGAIFNTVCDSGKTAVDYAKDREIFVIFNYLKMLFDKVQNGEAVFKILMDIEDMETRKCLMGAKNTSGGTLVDLAVVRNHPEVELLKTLCQTEVSTS